MLSSRNFFALAIILLALFSSGQTLAEAPEVDVERILAGVNTPLPGVKIIHPFNNALFPRDMASPDIIWEDADSGADRWLVVIDFQDKYTAGVVELAERNNWTPDKPSWEAVKVDSLNKPARLRVIGLQRNSNRAVSLGEIFFSTSEDELYDPILYQQVPLAFAFARDNPGSLCFRLSLPP